jgi:DNA-binding GntR family transcriptional regulator
MLAKNPFIPREEQVAQLIRELIREKNLMKGDQLPTVQELSKQFSVSKDMVGAALEILSYGYRSEIKLS